MPEVLGQSPLSYTKVLMGKIPVTPSFDFKS